MPSVTENKIVITSWSCAILPVKMKSPWNYIFLNTIKRNCVFFFTGIWECFDQILIIIGLKLYPIIETNIFNEPFDKNLYLLPQTNTCFPNIYTAVQYHSLAGYILICYIKEYSHYSHHHNFCLLIYIYFHKNIYM